MAIMFDVMGLRCAKCASPSITIERKHTAFGEENFMQCCNASFMSTIRYARDIQAGNPPHSHD
jgi:hypothetical protein